MAPQVGFEPTTDRLTVDNYFFRNPCIASKIKTYLGFSLTYVPNIKQVKTILNNIKWQQIGNKNFGNKIL